MKVNVKLRCNPGFMKLMLSVLAFSFFTATQAQTVSGTVSDETGKVLQGVSVSVKGTPGGTTTNASGKYSWVYQDNTHLTNFYDNRVPNLTFAIGSAYPGFDDYYEEGGGGAGIGWTISHNNGATLDETLSIANSAGIDHLQLITWNDFGEGTMIEPTVEFGYSFVEKIKSFAGVQDTGNVFGDISRLYELRKEHAGNSNIQKDLDKVFDYFVSMQPNKAVQLLDEIQ